MQKRHPNAIAITQDRPNPFLSLLHTTIAPGRTSLWKLVMPAPGDLAVYGMVYACQKLI